eukprot:c18563_g1_i1 orf=106-930(+)
MEAALGLMRRMPPSLSRTSLSSLLLLLPHHSSDLLSLVDQPLEVLWDEASGKQFLLCDYNRDGDSHRSPWSNAYFPPLEDGTQPPASLRALEVEANEIFALYRDQYYEGGISSVYFWETDSPQGFAACFLIKKDGSQSGDGRRGLLEQGLWDAIHVIEVEKAEDEATAHYCLTSTVMLSMKSNTRFQGSFNLSGSITRQIEADFSLSEGHLGNMGRMIEEMESKLRNGLDQVYFGKTREMVFTLREPLDALTATSSTGQSIQHDVISDIVRSRT